MKTDTPSPKPRRKVHWMRWALAALIAWSAWGGWKAYDLRKAKAEAVALGWTLDYDHPIDAIQADWRAFFRKETWLEGDRGVVVEDAAALPEHKALLHRLAPRLFWVTDGRPLTDLAFLDGLTSLRSLHIGLCPRLTSVDALKSLTSLEDLTLIGCESLTSIAGLHGHPSLKYLGLRGCPVLRDLDGLKSLPKLTSLELTACPQLTSLDALKGLASLKHLELSYCERLTNIDALKTLPSLKTIFREGCTGLPPGAVAELRAALPGAAIYSP